MSEISTILLVDDDDDYADTIGAFLAANGYAVRRAKSAREGVAFARDERPDLVLLDLMMEEPTAGLWALEEMRREPRLAGLPVFIVSSIYSAIPGVRISGDTPWLQHDAFIPKPVDYDLLLQRIRERLPGAVPVAGPGR